MHKVIDLREIAIIFLIFILGFSNILAQPIFVNDKLTNEVDIQAKNIMDKYQVPGMAFGITIDGKAYYFNYGLANKESAQPVTQNTIFELGSISKTFAMTLASYAQLQDKLSFSDKTSVYIHELKGSVIGNTTLLQLATYTAGGLPLQFPENVTNKSMMNYYRDWQPTFSQGIKRQYSNTSIGLVGYITALSMNGQYDNLIENVILKKLGMNNTFINVPDTKINQYAFGYNSNGDAIRVNPGILDSETYGIKSTSTDMVYYIQENMAEYQLDENIQLALNNTKKGYYQTSTFTQGLAWEMYKFPVTLDNLLEGNSNET
jgi:beta-lactamase class C